MRLVDEEIQIHFSGIAGVPCVTIEVHRTVLLQYSLLV
jgi:hypothetical protein